MAQQASMSTSLSSCCAMICASTGTAAATVARAGWGLPRQKLDSAQTVLRSMEMLAGCSTFWSSGGRAPHWSTWSRSSAPSPAMLPRHHAACSRTLAEGDSSRLQRCGTVPASTTARV